MDIKLEQVAPGDIERRSFEIIEREAGPRLPQGIERSVVQRVIHTTADFDYAENLVFSREAVERGIAALRSGASIVTDTQMAKAGVNKQAQMCIRDRRFVSVAGRPLSAWWSANRRKRMWHWCCTAGSSWR